MSETVAVGTKIYEIGKDYLVRTYFGVLKVVQVLGLRDSQSEELLVMSGEREYSIHYSQVLPHTLLADWGRAYDNPDDGGLYLLEIQHTRIEACYYFQRQWYRWYGPTSNSFDGPLILKEGMFQIIRKLDQLDTEGGA